MEYYTKEWFLAHQPGYIQPSEVQKGAVAAAHSVVEAYNADPRVLAAPPELADSLAAQADLTVLSVRRSADALVLSLGDDEGEWYKLTFTSPQIREMESIEGAEWLYSELFRLDARYQVNVLFWHNDSPLEFFPMEPHLRVLSLRCVEVICEEITPHAQESHDANPTKEM